MPHKLAVHKFCDEVTDHTRRIGAVNTLIVPQEDGASASRRLFVGDSTDWAGLHKIIKKQTHSWPRRPHIGLVTGAGGASRAVVYTLHQSGVNRIFIFNLTVANAEKIARDFQDLARVSVVPSLDSLREAPDVIIGTIPADRAREDDFDNCGLFGKSPGLCIDMSYKPRPMPLLAVAERRADWDTVEGFAVLLHQAFTQFELWTGLPAPKEVMNQEIDTCRRETCEGD